MRTIRLTLQYDGTAYQGWQRQKNTPQTIQETIESFLQRITREKVHLVAAGRTDAGVHARMQVAHFRTSSRMPVKKFQSALNGLLPEDIRVTGVRQMPAHFHSRYQALSKTYTYTILNRSYCDVFLRHRVYWYPLADLDISAMRRAGRILVGRHDFSSFKRTESVRKSAVRTVTGLTVSRTGDMIRIRITGQGFLYKMVRNIAGTLIEIGRGRLPVASIRSILAARNRTAAGPTAPGCGLCLEHIRY